MNKVIIALLTAATAFGTVGQAYAAPEFIVGKPVVSSNVELAQ